MNSVIYAIISFIVVLGVLVFVHELGHFLFAKLFGVRVLKFSLGFGNKVVGRQWGETEYLISAFPLGGYVKMFGEVQGDGEVSLAEQSRSFSHKPVWQRFGIVAGGPIFNLFFAVVLFFGMFFLAGLPEPVDTTVIGQVGPASAAEKAGIKSGDQILRINGKETTTWEQVAKYIGESGGLEVEVVVARGGEQLTIGVVPIREKIKNLFGEEEGESRYLIGIKRSEEFSYKEASTVEALEAALNLSWNLISVTFIAIVKIIERVIPASEMGGPILIAELAGQKMAAGWMELLYFMGYLSVNLGVLNLLPIPVLDGGHLVFLTIEGLRRRPLSDRAMEMSQKAGIFLLASLMIFVFYNDILRLVQRFDILGLVQRWMGT